MGEFNELGDVMAVRTQSCACGQVRFEAVDEPILAAVCYCDDCQAGGRLIEALDGAKPVLDADGGADYLTYRDDRYRCVQGAELLVGYALKPKSPTKRFVAGCCNTAMYLKYKRGHWTSTFRSAFESADLPAVEMRTNVRFRASDDAFVDDAPRYQRFPLALFGKLIKAQVAMVFGR